MLFAMFVALLVVGWGEEDLITKQPKTAFREACADCWDW